MSSSPHLKTSTTTVSKNPKSAHLIKSLYQLQNIASVYSGEILNPLGNGTSSSPLLSLCLSQSQHTDAAHKFAKLYRVEKGANEDSDSVHFLYGRSTSSHTIPVHDVSDFLTKYELKFSQKGDSTKYLSQLALFNETKGMNYSVNLPENYLGWIGSRQLRSAWVVKGAASSSSTKDCLIGNFEVLGAGEQKSAYFWKNEEKKDKFDYESFENWGEQMETLRYERLFVWDLDRDTVQEDLQPPSTESAQGDKLDSNKSKPSFREIKGIPEDVSVGQFVVTQSGEDIYFVGYKTQPRRLGLIYCAQRPSTLYKLSNWKDEDNVTCEAVCTEEHNVISPRLTPDGKNIYYLTTTNVPYHKSCLKLMKLELDTHKASTCVDIVRRPQESEPFPGLFLDEFQDSCFTSDSKFIITTVHWRSSLAVVRIHLETGKVERIQPVSEKNASMRVLDFKDNSLLWVETSPVNPYKVIYAKAALTDSAPLSIENWTVVEDSMDIISDSVRNELSQLEWDLQVLKAEDGLEYEYFVVKRKSPLKGEDNKEQFLSCPHGGPHSAVPAFFIYTYAFFALNGFTCVVPNYRGSIGFGQDSIEALPGHCGVMDIMDCHHAVTDAVEKYGDKSLTQVVSIRGGSHGGHITLRTIGRFPDYYKSAVGLNSVTNIASMVTSTDIPDWCWAEVGLEQRPSPTPEFLQKGYESSAIALVEKVKAPTLLLVGREDLRVPPSQSKEFYYCLKAQGVTTQLIFYPENCHPIGKPKDATDVILRTVDWLLKYSK